MDAHVPWDLVRYRRYHVRQMEEALGIRPKPLRNITYHTVGYIEPGVMKEVVGDEVVYHDVRTGQVHVPYSR